jgi:uncharacterized protein (TIGR03435 family)
MKLHTVVTIALSALCCSTFAQSAKPTPPGGEPLEWMAVSIHQMDPAHENNASANDQPNGISERGAPLASLISQAYNFGIMPMRDDEIMGLPGWAKSARYDVDARVAPEDVPAFKKLSGLSTADTIAAFTSRTYTGEMLMQQALLTERFHLKMHWEKGERNVYILTVAKGGARVKPTESDPNHGNISFSSGRITSKAVPVVFFASILEMPADRKIVDKTGLTGSYDMDLHFSSSNLSANTGEATNDPEFFTALQEQLGLKLQPAKMEIPILVVDHIDPPTDN